MRVQAELRSAISSGRARLLAFTRAVWNRDRTTMPPWSARRDRLLRIAIWTVRGVIAHRLALRAAALTYYVVFSLVPVLAVTLWILKALDFLPLIAPPATATSGPIHNQPFGHNELLRTAARAILVAVDRADKLGGGIVGMAALLYAVFKMFKHIEEALNAIAPTIRRASVSSYLLRYLALLAMPAVLVALSGLLAAAASGTIWAAAARLLGVLPIMKVAVGAGVVAGALALVVLVFYWAAARGRIPLVSAAVGAAAAAPMLLGVLWVFAAFQVGVAKASALQSGLAVVPVFMLWAYSSWFVVLLGAEIAVGHMIDRLVAHGAAVWDLDAAGQQAAAVTLMVCLLRAGGGPASAAALARQARLLPSAVIDLAGRLSAHGLLADRGTEGYVLACDPDRTTLLAIVVAVARDPALAPARAEVLRQLDPRGREALAAAQGATNRPLDPAGADGSPSLRELARG